MSCGLISLLSASGPCGLLPVCLSVSVSSSLFLPGHLPSHLGHPNADVPISPLYLQGPDVQIWANLVWGQGGLGLRYILWGHSAPQHRSG